MLTLLTDELVYRHGESLLEPSFTRPRPRASALRAPAAPPRYDRVVSLDHPRFEPRDLLLPPTLISLLRLPLAALFFAVHDRPALALATLAAAGLTDVLDGAVARRFHLTSATGATVDGVVDKVFVLSVVAALVVGNHMPWWQALAMGTRDVGEIVLLALMTLRARSLFGKLEPHATVAGKATTVAQFASVIASLLEAPSWPFVAAAAALGAVTVVAYARELERARVATPP